MKDLFQASFQKCIRKNAKFLFGVLLPHCHALCVGRTMAAPLHLFSQCGLQIIWYFFW